VEGPAVTPPNEPNDKPSIPVEERYKIMIHFTELLNSWLELLQRVSKQPTLDPSNGPSAMESRGGPKLREPSRWYDWPYGL